MFIVNLCFHLNGVNIDVNSHRAVLLHNMITSLSLLKLVLIAFLATDVILITFKIVIFLDFQSTKQGLSLVDSWSRGLG